MIKAYIKEGIKDFFGKLDVAIFKYQPRLPKLPKLEPKT